MIIHGFFGQRELLTLFHENFAFLHNLFKVDLLSFTPQSFSISASALFSERGDFFTISIASFS
jgi:hypothetical protein